MCPCHPIKVLFEGNRPYRWLFTSSKGGIVKKKTRDKTNHLTIKRRFTEYALTTDKRDAEEAHLAVVLYSDSMTDTIKDDDDWATKLVNHDSSGGRSIIAIRPGIANRRVCLIETLYQMAASKVSNGGLT